MAAIPAGTVWVCLKRARTRSIFAACFIYTAIDSFLFLIIYVALSRMQFWLMQYPIGEALLPLAPTKVDRIRVDVRVQERDRGIEGRMRSRATIGVALCLGCWLVAACAWPQTIPTGDSPQVTLLPPGSTQTPGPLTDAEAIALAGEELVSREVDPHTATITIGSEPRRASIRYSSSYSVDGPAFQAQTVLVTLGVSRVMARVQPPIDGGARVAVLPDEEGEVGLRVTVIDGTSLEAWANGSISDQDFVSGWTVGTGTRE